MMNRLAWLASDCTASAELRAVVPSGTSNQTVSGTEKAAME